VVGLNELNMHSLYMTVLYQFGIVGSVLYIGLIVSIPWNLYRQRFPKGELRLHRLRYACLLAVVFFLVHEIKFEFNRSDSYQQIVWALLAACHLVSRTTSEHPVEETRVDSPPGGEG